MNTIMGYTYTKQGTMSRKDPPQEDTKKCGSK